MKIVNLRVENKVEPLGIDEKRPVFSWNVETGESNWKQAKYRILTGQSEAELETGKDWDSDWVKTKDMVNIPYEGKGLKPQTGYLWKVQVESEEGEVAESDAASFETGMLGEKELWEGDWIGETDPESHHLYRKSFTAEKEIAKARVYICGLGHFEMFANGRKVEEYVLEPGWTTYGKSVQYVVYDMTKYLQTGANGIGIMLGDGMYHVPKKQGRYTYFPRSYGYTKVLMQLNIWYTDGSMDRIYTDESWKMGESPIRYSSIYGGEEFDAEKWNPDFSKGDFDDESWEKVHIVEAPEGKLVCQPTHPLKVMEHYKPVKVKELEPGVYLYDFGKNFSGWVQISVKRNQAEPGNRIKMKPGEILKPDGKPDQKVTGKNYSWDYYMNGDEKQEYGAHFTYTGFRYLQVEGAVPAELAKDGESGAVIENITGEFVYPDMEKFGEFWCSNELFNQIHGIITQAMLSNTKSIFTDCPHREKLGWMEQTHLIGPAIMYNYDVQNLYEKIEKDMMEAQWDTGLVPDICPEYVTGFAKYNEGFVDSPEWGSACIINLWYVYKKYGNKAVFERYYDTMKKYLQHLTNRSHNYLLTHGLGDWLDIGPCVPYSQNTPKTIVATCIYYYDIRIMIQVAKLLEKERDAAEYEVLADHVKEEYTALFYDKQTYRYGNGSQAAQAMSLIAGLADPENEEKVVEQLVKDIRGRGNATTAGDVGHPFVLAALTKYNRSDVIHDMMLETERPGYGYQVKCGATTLSEEWDGPDPERPHASQNHFMLGSGEEWFYAGLAGIQGMRYDQPFDEILIKPYFGESVEEVKVWHKHPYGKIRVEWKRIAEDKVQVFLELPPNTTGKFVADWNDTEVSLGSGKYEFIVTKPEEA